MSHFEKVKGYLVELGHEIKEEDAEGNVAYIYSDLRKSLNIEVVNTIWRYLATIDGGLEWVWISSKKLYMSTKNKISHCLFK